MFSGLNLSTSSTLSLQHLSFQHDSFSFTPSALRGHWNSSLLSVWISFIWWILHSFLLVFFLLYIFFSICLFLAKAAMLTKAYEGNKGISIEGELWDLQNSVYWEKMCNGKKQSRTLRVRGARAAHGISGELQELKPAINLASCPENTSPASYAFVWSIPTSVAMRWCYALNTGPANTYFAKNRHSLQRSYSLLNLPNVYWSSWPGLSPVCTSSCLLVAFL